MNFFRPIRPLLKGWLLSFAGFGFVAFVISVQFLSTENSNVEFAIRSSLRDFLPWAVVTPLLFRLVARFPLERRQWPSRLAFQLLACLVMLFVCQWWKNLIHPDFRSRTGGMPAHEFGPPPGPPDGSAPGDFPQPPPFGGGPGEMGPPPGEGRHLGPRYPIDLVYVGTFQLPLFLMIMSAAHASLFYRRDRERAASLAKARLDVLMTQLQPHFLFNTLNTIAELVHEDANKADAMITALSEMLRLTLDANATQLVPLQREIEFIERYFDIMQTRFGERLQYECDITAEASRGMVPPFLLQPLVENAIRHGLEPKPAGGKIWIGATVENCILRISIRDNGIGLPHGQPKQEGLGLANTRERLKQIYGDAAAVALDNGSGLEVKVTLPFRVT